MDIPDKGLIDNMDTGELAPVEPCPFCGSLVIDWDSGEYRLHCLNCGSMGPGGASDTETIERWNTRALLPGLQGGGE